MSYFEHASSPYPVADEQTAVPSDLLVDMSLTVHPSIKDDVRITVLQATSAFAFVALETTTEAVAHVFVQNPRPGRIYRFDDDATGWVMFGPGISNDYTLPENTVLELDPKCLIVEGPDQGGFSLIVNGTTYVMPDNLSVRADGFLRMQLQADRSIDPGTGAEDLPVLVISRDDDNIDETSLTRGMVDEPQPPIRIIGDAVPDAAGNLEITVELEESLEGEAGVYVVPCANTKVAGFILWTKGVKGCGNDDLLEQLKFSDCGAGAPYELPFDKLLEKFKKDETPCGTEPPDCRDLEPSAEPGGSE